MPSAFPPIQRSASNPDELAFYLPFHFYRPSWGVFLKASGVVSVAAFLKGTPLEPGDDRYLSWAEAFLKRHELFHAACELACTRAELLARHSLYREYFWSEQAIPLEEAVATAQSIRWFSFAPELSGKLGGLMLEQGLGYRDFGSWLARGPFGVGKELLAREMTSRLAAPAPGAANSLHSLFRGWELFRSMPITKVDDLGPDGVSILRPFPKAFGLQIAVHSNDHPPPHVHIRDLSAGDETRYEWPSWMPLRGNPPLSRQSEKGLHEYRERFEDDIASRIKAVYPQAR